MDVEAKIDDTSVSEVDAAEAKIDDKRVSEVDAVEAKMDDKIVSEVDTIEAKIDDKKSVSEGDAVEAKMDDKSVSEVDAVDAKMDDKKVSEGDAVEAKMNDKNISEMEAVETVKAVKGETKLDDQPYSIGDEVEVKLELTEYRSEIRQRAYRTGVIMEVKKPANYDRNILNINRNVAYSVLFGQSDYHDVKHEQIELICSNDASDALVESKTLDAHTGRLSVLCVSPDGSRLYSCCTGNRDTTIKVWDSTTYDCLQILNEQTIGKIRKGDKVEAMKKAECVYKGTVDRVNSDGSFDITFADGERRRGVEKDSVWFFGTSSLSISPDGRRLFSGSDNGTIKVWDTTTYRCISTLNVSWAFQNQGSWLCMLPE